MQNLTPDEIKNKLIWALKYPGAIAWQKSNSDNGGIAWCEGCDMPMIYSDRMLSMVCPLCGETNETEDEEKMRWWGYWTWHSQGIPEHQLMAIWVRYIQCAWIDNPWPETSERLGISIKSAQDYTSHGLATVVERIGRMLEGMG